MLFYIYPMPSIYWLTLHALYVSFDSLSLVCMGLQGDRQALYLSVVTLHTKLSNIPPK